jgi:hypothetical protein
MNPKNQTVHRKLEDTWTCLECSQKIIPFEKGANKDNAEALVFIIGLGISGLIQFYIGLFLVIFSVIMYVIRSFAITKKVCPACESERIIPSTSATAKRLARQ